MKILIVVQSSNSIFLKIIYNLSQYMVKLKYGGLFTRIHPEELKMSDFVQTLSDTLETAKQRLSAPPAQLAPQRAPATPLEIVKRMARDNSQPH